MTRPWMRGKWFYALLFVVLSILFAGFDTLLNYESLKNFMANEEHQEEAEFNRHEQALHNISNLFYETSINTDRVIGLYSRLQGADKTEKDKIRVELWNTLKDKYAIFHRFRIQQLHFQLPDNESFLRFHKPEKYGDNLTGVRPTIEYVNRTHKPISGFEEGRIFNGFRYVYPLFGKKGEYLGSVEVSSSALSYKEAFEQDKSEELDIVMRAEVVESKVFDSEKGNYETYPMNPEFRIEKSMVEYESKTKGMHKHSELLQQFGKQHNVQAKMGRMERFSLIDNHDGKYVLVTFLPLSNTITKEKVGYAIIFRESEYLAKALRNYLMEITFAVFAAWITTVIFFFVQTNIINRQKLAVAFAEAEEANRAKDVFLSSMSHELRTPLNAIIGFAQIVSARADLPEAIRPYLEKINIAGKNLLSLVNTLLDFSKIESGKLEIAPYFFDIHEMLSEVMVMIEPMTHKKSIDIRNGIPADTKIYADRQWLKQVFVNLLSNAVKFSDSDSVIYLEYGRKDNWECFTVRDEGMGISAEKIDMLFKPFVQLREHQNNAIKGTGLGLSIVKKIVEIHNGKITVQSTEGNGSSFTVWLPLQG